MFDKLLVSTSTSANLSISFKIIEGSPSLLTTNQVDGGFFNAFSFLPLVCIAKCLLNLESLKILFYTDNAVFTLALAQCKLAHVFGS